MKKILIISIFVIIFGSAGSAFSADNVTCTIEKRLTTDLVLDKPMVSKEVISLEAKPFGKNYIFSLSPAEAECEIRIPNKNNGSFLNCWTLDKKYGFRSDRTTIDENRRSVPNTLSIANAEKKFVVQIIVTCE